MDSGYRHEKLLIAPCGMNCSICIGHMRNKKSCPGCYKLDDPEKPLYCRSCAIVNCDRRAGLESGFCYDCEIFPCKRLKNLDKRYRNRYRMSMIDNQLYIRDHGLKKFLDNEYLRWKCKSCGAKLSAHRNNCISCSEPVPEDPRYPRLVK